MRVRRSAKTTSRSNGDRVGRSGRTARPALRRPFFGPARAMMAGMLGLRAAPTLAPGPVGLGTDGDGITTVRRSDLRGRSLARFAVGVGGWTFGVLIVYWGFSLGFLRLAGGDEVMYAAVGRAFWTGGDVYGLGVASQPFLYSPPWAALFGLFPSATAIHVAVIAGNLIALRYVAGSWLAVGYLAYFPIVPWELAWGNINIMMAAAIVAGVRGRGALPMAFGLAKWSPWLALSPKAWRGAAAVLGLALVVTLPRLDTWPAWIARLLWMNDHPLGPLVPVPLAIRAGLAVALLAMRRPWSRALAAVVATPAFYVASFVLMIAPICVWLRRLDRPSAMSGAADHAKHG